MSWNYYGQKNLATEEIPEAPLIEKTMAENADAAKVASQAVVDDEEWVDVGAVEEEDVWLKICIQLDVGTAAWFVARQKVVERMV